MDVMFVFDGGDGDIHGVTKLQELDVEDSLYKFHRDGEAPLAADHATITHAYAGDTPFSALIVHDGGSGVVENVERIEQVLDDSQTLEVHYEDGSTEEYELGTISMALDQPEFDEDRFEDDPALWSPYDPCPFCESTTFHEVATYEQTVEATDNDLQTKHLEQTDVVSTTCKGCGEELVG